MSNETNKLPHNIPEGYENQSDDITVFYDPETGPIHFIPRTAKVMDSRIDDKKASELVIGELVEPLEGYGRDEEGEKIVVNAKKGDIVGVWMKPGMKALKNLKGVPVYMFMTGEKDTGKPNPMKTFSVNSKKKGSSLLIEEDLRNKSKNNNTILGSMVAAEVPF